MHDGRIADDFQRDQPDGAPNIVAANAVSISLDGREHEMIDRPDVGEPVCNLLRPCKIKCQAAMSADDLGGGGGGAPLIAAGHHHVLTP